MLEFIDLISVNSQSVFPLPLSRAEELNLWQAKA
jgi:hypothetical protein